MEKKKIIQRTLNVASPIASAMSICNPAFLAIPVIASVSNELFGYFDSKSTEKRLTLLQEEVQRQKIEIEQFKEMIALLDEHAQYVVRNNIKNFCLEALPETTVAYAKCIIAYIKKEKQELDEEICEILQSCNANDIQILSLIKEYLKEGSRTEYTKKQEEVAIAIREQREGVKKWYDRNVIYDENTIFWKDIMESFCLIGADDMGRLLNQAGKKANGEEALDWAYLIRSVIKLHSLGVLQVEFVSTLGVVSQNNIERIHITLFGQRLLEFI